MSDGFLYRWSRRKEAMRRAETGSMPQAERTTELVAKASQPPADAPDTRVAEPVLTPADIAALPKIDTLTGESDITGFMRPGVPEQLRNAALRKVWALDPAIRDFGGHARDYAYDWNAPGGVPGYGALEARDDVEAMVRRILGEPNTASLGQSVDEIARHRTGAVRSDEGGAHQETASEDRKSAAASGEAETGTRRDGAQPAMRPAR